MNDELLESLLREADPAADLSVPSLGRLTEQVRRRHAQIRRRRSYTRNLAGATVCYTVGMLTMWLWMRSPEQTKYDSSITQATSVTAPASTGVPERDMPEHSDAATVAASLPASPATPYQALRTLGDRYLLRQGKVNLAVDAYTRALDHASPSESEVTYEHDSWLLISLKRDRLVSSL